MGTRIFQQSKTKRLGGPDGITDALTRIAPKEMTRKGRPITKKAQMATVEPASHKGGRQTSVAEPDTEKTVCQDDARYYSTT